MVCAPESLLHLYDQRLTVPPIVNHHIAELLYMQETRITGDYTWKRGLAGIFSAEQETRAEFEIAATRMKAINFCV